MVLPKANEYLHGQAMGSELSYPIWDKKKFRILAVFDRASFPWGDGGFVIHGLKLRRNGGIVYELPRHTKTSSVVLSIDGRSPSGLSATFVENHGSTVARVDGEWQFEDSGRIRDGAINVAQPFSSSFTFPAGREFTVPPGARNLVVEVEVTVNAIGDDEDWWPDHAGDIDYGSLRRVGNSCPIAGNPPRPMADAGAQDVAPGRSFELWVVDDDEVQGGQAFVWFGPLLPRPLVCPNGCELWVDGMMTLPLTNGFERLVLDQRLPNDVGLVGQTFGCQFGALNQFWRDGFGMSAGHELTIGSGLPAHARHRAVAVFVGENDPLPPAGTITDNVPILEVF
jgi:hypothetical protein